MIFHRYTYKFLKVIKSIVSLIAYQFNQFLEHYRGPEYRAVLQDFDNALRAKIKYDNEEGSFEEARYMLEDELKLRNLSLWD